MFGSLFITDFLLLCLFMCYLYVSMCIYVHVTQGTIRNQEKALQSIELEL